MIADAELMERVIRVAVFQAIEFSIIMPNNRIHRG